MTGNSAHSPEPSMFGDSSATGDSPAGEVLAAGPTEGSPASRGVFLIVGAIALVILAAVGAVALVLSRGPQPQDVIPDTALGLIVVDLDPSLGQKVNLVRLSNSLPDSGVTLNADDPVGSLLAEDPDAAELWTGIKPWFGSKAAVAAVPDADGRVAALLAVEVSDESQARSWLTSRVDDAEDLGLGEVEFAFRDGYALISDSAWVVDQAVNSDNPLSASPEFAADRQVLGDQIIWGWLDAARTAKTVRSALESEDAGALLDPFLYDIADSVPDAQGRLMFGVAAQPTELSFTVLSEDVSVDDFGSFQFTGSSDAGRDVPAAAVASLGIGGLSVDSALVDAIREQTSSTMDAAQSTIVVSTATTVARTASTLHALFDGQPAGTGIDTFNGEVVCASTCAPQDALAAAFTEVGFWGPSSGLQYEITGVGADVTAVVFSMDDPSQCATIAFANMEFTATPCPDGSDAAAESDPSSWVDTLVTVLSEPVTAYVIPLPSPAGSELTDAVVLIRTPKESATGVQSLLTELEPEYRQGITEAGDYTWLGFATDGRDLTAEEVAEFATPSPDSVLARQTPEGGLVAVSDIARLAELDEGWTEQFGPFTAASISVTSGADPGDGRITLSLSTEK